LPPRRSGGQHILRRWLQSSACANTRSGAHARPPQWPSAERRTLLPSLPSSAYVRTQGATFAGTPSGRFGRRRATREWRSGCCRSAGTKSAGQRSRICCSRACSQTTSRLRSGRRGSRGPAAPFAFLVSAACVHVAQCRASAALSCRRWSFVLRGGSSLAMIASERALEPTS